MLWALFFVSSSAPGIAGEPVTSIASVRIGAAGVDWLPHVDYDHLVLTVAGPQGLYIQREFRSGEIPSFNALDIQNRRLPDGGYTYELRTVSRQEQELRDKLARAREAGGESTLDELRKGKLPENPRAQSGHLWVQGGAFVNLGSIQRSPVSQSKPASKPPLNNFPLKDIVQPDDVVVQGRACIGPVCAAVGPADPLLTLKGDFGELFQIKLESVSCCHPSTRDWAIQTNNISEATGDFLIRSLDPNTIPFRISADAPDNVFTVFPFSGNIGLGTLTPAVRLDVKTTDAGKATQRLQNSSATGFSGTEYLNNAGTIGLFFGIDNAASTTRLNSTNSNPIVILTNGTERMRVTSAGSLGIGTTTPSSKLHVNGGDIRVSGGSFIDDGVTLNAPDYVFEPSYSLMPLAQLREFVSREKHLPNVPTAADIKKQGLDLSKFQMRLLEKVEELALYTLAQDEHVRSLSDENQALKARLNALSEKLAAIEERKENNH